MNALKSVARTQRVKALHLKKHPLEVVGRGSETQLQVYIFSAERYKLTATLQNGFYTLSDTTSSG